MKEKMEQNAYFYEFKQGGWDPADWQIVRSPRWTDVSHWEQHPDHIANYVPADLRPEDMQMGRDRTGEEAIFSMLLKQPVEGSFRNFGSLRVDGRMAPLLFFRRRSVRFI